VELVALFQITCAQPPSRREGVHTFWRHMRAGWIDASGGDLQRSMSIRGWRRSWARCGSCQSEPKAVSQVRGGRRRNKPQEREQLLRHSGICRSLQETRTCALRGDAGRSRTLITMQLANSMRPPVSHRGIAPGALRPALHRAFSSRPRAAQSDLISVIDQLLHMRRNIQALEAERDQATSASAHASVCAAHAGLLGTYPVRVSPPSCVRRRRGQRQARVAPHGARAEAARVRVQPADGRR
jgi:hypothetical protein